MIKKVLIPSDPKQFKQELLKIKRARKTLVYKDGRVKVEIWNAYKFKPTSNLMGNIDSQLWHRKDTSEIIEAIYEIEYLDNLGSNCLKDTGYLYPVDLYIHYKKGWSSFRPTDEHIVEYIIKNDMITIIYAKGFGPTRTEVRKISHKCISELFCIFRDALVVGVLENSNTAIRTEHGLAWAYDYGYNGRIERDCISLFTDDALNTRYGNLIDNIIN